MYPPASINRGRLANKTVSNGKLPDRAYIPTHPPASNRFLIKRHLAATICVVCSAVLTPVLFTFMVSTPFLWCDFDFRFLAFCSCVTAVVQSPPDLPRQVYNCSLVSIGGSLRAVVINEIMCSVHHNTNGTRVIIDD